MPSNKTHDSKIYNAIKLKIKTFTFHEEKQNSDMTCIINMLKHPKMYMNWL